MYLSLAEGSPCRKTGSSLFGRHTMGSILRADFHEDKIVGYDKNTTAGEQQDKTKCTTFINTKL